jgi:hypothetical protein
MQFSSPWYFILHLWNEHRPARDQVFEIQLLGSDGRASGWGYVGYNESELQIDVVAVPFPALDIVAELLSDLGDLRCCRFDGQWNSLNWMARKESPDEQEAIEAKASSVACQAAAEVSR